MFRICELTKNRSCMCSVNDVYVHNLVLYSSSFPCKNSLTWRPNILCLCTIFYQTNPIILFSLGHTSIKFCTVSCLFSNWFFFYKNMVIGWVNASIIGSNNSNFLVIIWEFILCQKLSRSWETPSDLVVQFIILNFFIKLYSFQIFYEMMYLSTPPKYF